LISYIIDKEVLFLGFVKRRELIALYKNAFAMTFATFVGPDNIPPLEAMALRCPVVSSTYKGAKEQLKDAALFFDPLNENELVNEVKRLMDSDVRENLIRKGEILAQEYSLNKYVSAMMKLIDEFADIRECWRQVV